jgi:hypothetical protein
MKKIILSCCFFLAYVTTVAQTYTLGINPSPACGGCNSACNTLGYCTPAGTTPTGNCPAPGETVYTPIVAVPPNSNVRIQVTTRACDAATDGLDAGDFCYVNGAIVVTGAGNTRVNYDQCFFTGATASSASVGLTANRRDETLEVIFTITPGPGTGCAALPAPLRITLSSFAATIIANNTIKINWVVDNETNNNYTSLEKSIDGYSFIEINKLISAGNSTTQQQYEFTDATATAKINYYRLKSVDNNGTISYSNVIAVNNKQGQEQITVIPDFANKVVKVYSNSTSLIKGVNLYTASGALVSYNQVSNGTYFTMDLKNIPSGIYFIKTLTNKSTYLNKIWIP